MNHTPKYIHQAILNGMTQTDARDLIAHQKQFYELIEIKEHVIQFLSRHFNRAMLDAMSDEEVDRIRDLYIKITK